VTAPIARSIPNNATVISPVTDAPSAALSRWLDALGFHQHTATRQFTAAGGTWSRYAATRRPPRPPAGPAAGEQIVATDRSEALRAAAAGLHAEEAGTN